MDEVAERIAEYFRVKLSDGPKEPTIKPEIQGPEESPIDTFNLKMAAKKLTKKRGPDNIWGRATQVGSN